ncbi:uncharacterized protein [Medicago truncatula]|uniref:uncharacterized protein n=1 Tax=Medicago truncatula TaxID=3880 RepID=UPI0019688D72|nr:uncharacterized protein LOC112422519 [Medicago truncatula]
MPEKNKNRVWRYVNRKFILSVEARDWVKTTVRDAWRRYKHKIKKNHFLKYRNMTERLKHCPPKVPIAHFRELCEFYSKEPIQALAESNAKNRAQLKCLHRMGPQNFSLTREKLCEKGKKRTHSIRNVFLKLGKEVEESNWMKNLEKYFPNFKKWLKRKEVILKLLKLLWERSVPAGYVVMGEQ